MTKLAPGRLAAVACLLWIAAAATAGPAAAEVRRVCCQRDGGVAITEMEDCAADKVTDDRACWEGGIQEAKICCFKSHVPFLVERDVCLRNRGIEARASACWPSTKKKGDICCALPDRYRFMDIKTCRSRNGRRTAELRCR